MGRDKASLPFGDETMLARVVRLLSTVVPVERLVCVAAQGQSLPPLPTTLRIVRDRHPDRGPLEGLAVGLAAVADLSDLAFVTTCDAPLLQPQLATTLATLASSPNCEATVPPIAAVPQINGRWHPLTAVYRTELHTSLDQHLAAGNRRVTDWVESLNACKASELQLQAVDPHLLSLQTCNTDQEYQQALRLLTPNG